MAKRNTIKAYVDGFLYMYDEQICIVCGRLTNRINVEHGKRQCLECDEKNLVLLDNVHTST